MSELYSWFKTLILMFTTYDCALLHYMIRKGGPPFGSAIFHWYLLPRPCSLTPRFRMSHPPPSPYHWARLASAGSAKPGVGRGKRSVCSGNFTHVTHIVKLFRWIKYYRLRTLHIWNIANKTSFRSCTLFHIFDLLQIDPTSFGGGGREQGRFAKI